MVADQEVLLLLERGELTAKQLASQLEQSPVAVYRCVGRLVGDGLVRKGQKFVKGRPVAVYSVLDRAVEGGCWWQQVKEMLIASKVYQNNALEVDFWPFLRGDIQNLKARKETLDLLVVGLKGIGKSITVLWLASQFLDPHFSIAGNVIFRKEQLLRLAIDQPCDRAFLLDDLGTSLDSRNWQEGERQAIFSFFEICRQNRIHLLGTSPSLDLVDLNFRRLIRYLFDCQLKCSGHLHIVVHRSVNPGLKPVFKPVGVLTVPYPVGLQGMIDEYERVKKEQLRGSARDLLERLDRAKEGVRNFVISHSPIRITEDFVRLALRSCDLDGGLSKQDRDALRTEMFDVLEGKKKADKKAEARKVETEKEARIKAKLAHSYRVQFQKFVDQGRSLDFSRQLSYRLVYEKAKAVNLKNFLPVFNQLVKRIKPLYIENFVLGRLDDIFLVWDLKIIREAFEPFKDFDQLFNSKLWVMVQEDAQLASNFIVQAVQLKNSFLYKHHNKFSPKKWQAGVLFRLKALEFQERQSRAREAQSAGLSAAIVDLGYLLFAKQNPGLLAKVKNEKQSPFWADVKV